MQKEMKTEVLLGQMVLLKSSLNILIGIKGSQETMGGNETVHLTARKTAPPSWGLFQKALNGMIFRATKSYVSFANMMKQRETAMGPKEMQAAMKENFITYRIPQKLIRMQKNFVAILEVHY